MTHHKTPKYNIRPLTSIFQLKPSTPVSDAQVASSSRVGRPLSGKDLSPKARCKWRTRDVPRSGRKGSSSHLICPIELHNIIYQHLQFGITWLVPPQPATIRDLQTGHPCLQVQVVISCYITLGVPGLYPQVFRWLDPLNPPLSRNGFGGGRGPEV